MTDPLHQTYDDRYRLILVPIAANLQRLISDHLKGTPRIDRIIARAKEPERFLEKANRSGSNGKLRYSTPFTQIQDQIGARVVILYNNEVDLVGDLLLRYFQPIEMRSVVPDSEWKFGYFGRHFILALPGDIIPSGVNQNDAPRFFELQIKTVFQHAWSEANHDLGYKPVDKLSDDQTRRLAFTAAQAWGADRIFGELFNELQPHSGNVSQTMSFKK